MTRQLRTFRGELLQSVRRALVARWAKQRGRGALTELVRRSGVSAATIKKWLEGNRIRPPLATRIHQAIPPVNSKDTLT